MNDPLNISISGKGVDTSLPVLPEGDYPLQIVESVIVPNSRKDGYNWHLKLATTSVLTDVSGREVKPNFPLFQDIALQPKEGSTDPDGFKRNLFAAVDAIFGTTEADRPDFSNELVQQAVGKLVTATVIVDKWQGADNNKVRRLKKAA